MRSQQMTAAVMAGEAPRALPVRLAQKSQQVVALDAVRALAALVVFLGHVRIVCFVPWESLSAPYKTLAATLFYAVARFGQEAVLVFFVLSGFFVGGQVIARFESGRFRIADYAVDRATRILLPLVPACLLTVIASYALNGNMDDLSNILGSAVGLNGIVVETAQQNPPLWSIAFEIWFYVVAGVVANLFGAATSGVARWLVFGLLALCACVFSVLNASFLLFWFIGALVYKRRDDLSSPAFLVVGLVLVVAGTYLFERADVGHDVMARDRAVYWQALICMGFAVVIPCLASNGLNKVLRPVAGVASFMAASSYSLYVFHYPVLQLMSLFVPRVESFGAGAVVEFIVLSATSFGICVGFWHLFERHTDGMRAMIKRRLAQRG